MNLKINKQRAIEILQFRRTELYGRDFNPTSWKAKTANDINAIFPSGAVNSIDVKFLDFDTFVESDKIRKFNVARDAASDLMLSYIQYINTYVPDIVPPVNDFKAQYNELLLDWNALVPKWNSILTEKEEWLKEKQDLVVDNQDLKANTIRYDNLTLLRIFKAIGHLPFWEATKIIGIVLGLLTGGFFMGTWYENYNNKVEQYDLRKENDNKAKTIDLKNDTISEYRNQLILSDTTIAKLKRSIKR